MEKYQKLLKTIIFIGFILLIVIIFSQQIDFTGIDLGRHLENGKIVWQNPQVLFQNFYSYTEPNFPFINHHWLSGVIFYNLYTLGGFGLLMVFNVLIAVTPFRFAPKLAVKKANFYLSSVIALPVIYLLSERVEIRPEIFSYLFIILTWYFIDRTARDKKWSRLWYLIPIFLFWVNIHIYFFLGLILIGFKLVAEFIPVFIKSVGNLQSRFKETWPTIKPWAIALATSIFVCLLNPNTWRGLLYPFNIFRNYGYDIAENKSSFYLEHLTLNPNFLLFKIILGVLVISWLVYYLFFKKVKIFELLIGLLFSFLAIFASRNLAIFGLVALIIISSNLAQPLKYLTRQIVINEKIKVYTIYFFIFLIFSGFIYLIIDSQTYNKVIKNNLGFSLREGSADSIKFFEDNNLSGPIFNNYNIGSALIFWLPATEKVFVDNRPEAYSNDFFKKTYIPLQNDPVKWQAGLDLYKFKTIYFSYTDSTPWAQQFLARILNDDNWSLVYFDRYTVILLNKKLTDKSVINKLGLNETSVRNQLRLLVTSSSLKNKLSLASLAELIRQPFLAEEIYHGILINNPDYTLAKVSLGYFYSKSTKVLDLDKSLKYFETALEEGYTLPRIYNQIGLVNWNLGKYKKAEDAWKSALKLEGKNETSLYYLKQIEEFKTAGKSPLN